MAILNQDDQNNQNQIPGQQSSNPSAAPTITQPGQAAGGMYTAQKQPSGGGRFTNIQKYLTANQGGQEQISGGIENKANKEATSVREGIAASQQKFNQAVQPEQQRLASAQPFVQQTLSQAGQGQLTPEQIAQFQQYKSGGGAYQNINGLENVPSVNNLNQAAQQAGTESGRFELLRQTFGQPSYSRGQQRLDQLLLQLQQPGQLQRNLQNVARTTEQEQQTAQQSAQQQSEVLRNQALEAASKANEGLTQAQQDLQTSITGRASKSQQDADQLKDYLTRAMGQGLDTPEDIQKALALAGQSGINLNQEVYNVNKDGAFRPEQFLQSQTFSADNVASQEERARAAALAQLGGTEQTFLAGNAPSGAAPSLNNVFNQDSFSQAAAKQKSAYQKEATPFNNIGDFQKAITSGGYNPTQTVNKLVQHGLDPNIAHRILYSDEFQGGPGTGGGMHRNAETLQMAMDQYGPQVQRALAAAMQSTKQQYGAGTTLADLIKKGRTIPMQGGIGQLPPVATGVGGKIGLF